MRIGVICYASVGGSGVVATELGHALAARGHDVHLISSEHPFRWRPAPRLAFEAVDVPAYPLFREPQYLLALANTLVRLSVERRLEILHAHYAVPHATAAYLAHQILEAELGHHAPRTVTTLHGTDITLVGSDPSYARVVAFSIEQSHGVTAVSESLKKDTLRALGIQREIRVIPNFLDTAVYARRPDPALRGRLCPPGCAGVVVHVSNFRPVKRVGLVVEVFRRVRERLPARLVLVGDGPDRPDVERRIAALGLTADVDVVFEQQDLVPWLSSADVFLLTSSQESFGLAALEAMACGTPVVAARVGGLPEIIDDGRTSFLCGPEDASAMAARVTELLENPARRESIGRASALDTAKRFSEDDVVPRYEAYYQHVLGRR
ncbi:MAG: N-acetyl-alpha-D-glucosaminyl L-malate synthase BshA [Vicinamibacterales bacterium]